ncbi:fimbrial protein [Serratia sp. T13T92]|uniref:fimbrial protein n=1 Tax=Serratia sp. T13T92 TaxID=3397496 RepID=UPI0039E072A9
MKNDKQIGCYFCEEPCSMCNMMDKRLLIAMGRIIVLVVIIAYSAGAMAFVCSTDNGPFVIQGNRDIHVSMTPEIQQNYNLIVDLSRKIKCYNEDVASSGNYDWVVFTPGSEINSLPGSTKSIILDSNIYPSPLDRNTQPYGFPPGREEIPLPLSFVISPINSAGEEVISAGELVAKLTMYKTYPNSGGPPQQRFTWNIYSNSNVYIPIGGCDVSARDVSVLLPPYDADSNQPFPVQLTVNCPSGNKQLYYTLSGTTDRSQTIFTNMAPAAPTPAKGVGIQMLDSNDNVITAGRPVSLGTVGPSSVDLKLKARYAQTGGQVTAGPVKSIIAVVFTYP